jgi:hypothetical protein
MASEIKVDTISEKTSANGVTIDGALIKDSQLAATAGGSLVLLETRTASSSSELLFDNFVDTSLYASYHIEYNQIKPVNDNVAFRAIFRTGGASGADQTGTYYMGGVYYSPDSASGAVSSNNSYSNFVNIESALGNANGEALMGQAKFYPAVGDSTQNIGQLHSNIGHQRYDDTTRGSFRIGIIEAPGTENTGIRFFMSSGDIASGSIYIFGVKK